MDHTDQSARFATDIKPLFRDKDVHSMRFAFKLHKYDDVREQAEHILERLRAREMRCDGERRTERVDLFDRWVRGGKQP